MSNLLENMTTDIETYTLPRFMNEELYCVDWVEMQLHQVACDEDDTVSLPISDEIWVDFCFDSKNKTIFGSIIPRIENNDMQIVNFDNVGVKELVKILNYYSKIELCKICHAFEGTAYGYLCENCYDYTYNNPLTHVDCVICMELLPKYSCELACGHLFHYECIETMICETNSRNITCPTCRHLCMMRRDYYWRYQNSREYDAVKSGSDDEVTLIQPNTVVYDEDDFPNVDEDVASILGKMFSPIKKRKNVPSAIKRLVWNKYIGDCVRVSKCVCCNDEPIVRTGFHCGHVIAYIHGGADTVENMRPICQNCNLSMGTQNMSEFMTKHGLHFV